MAKGNVVDIITDKEVLDFGRKIRAARENKKWTQKVLAEKLGVTQPSISKIENGYRVPSGKILLWLIRHLRVVF